MSVGRSGTVEVNASAANGIVLRFEWTVLMLTPGGARARQLPGCGGLDGTKDGCGDEVIYLPLRKSVGR